jgi:hypothetical protein
MTKEEWMEKTDKEFWDVVYPAYEAEQAARRAGGRGGRSLARESGVGGLNVPGVVSIAMRAAGRTLTPMGTSLAQAASTGKGLGALDPAGLSATAGDELFFGVPRRVSKEIEEVGRTYETRYPNEAKGAKFIGEARRTCQYPECR